MTYLTQSHSTPPRHIEHEGYLVPTRSLMQRGDSQKLAQLGVYPHVTTAGDAPLGYTDWQFDGSQYTREPAGTAEERQAALDAQEAAQQEAYLDELSCTRLQARLELLNRGLWDSVQQWATAEGGATQAFFEDAQSWQFRDAHFQAGVTALGLTEAQAIEMVESAQQR
jgi:hypothetical protein